MWGRATPLAFHGGVQSRNPAHALQPRAADPSLEDQFTTWAAPRELCVRDSAVFGDLGTRARSDHGNWLPRFREQRLEAAAQLRLQSLQIQLQKNVGDFRVLGAYTWSKSIDKLFRVFDAINPYNPDLTRALSTFDVTNNFVVSYSYDLPFAKSVRGVRASYLVVGQSRGSRALPQASRSRSAKAMIVRLRLQRCGCAEIRRYGDPFP